MRQLERTYNFLQRILILLLLLAFVQDELKRGPSMRYSSAVFLHKSEAYGQVTSRLAKKIEISKVGVIN